MLTSLSKLIDNLSKIYKKNAKNARKKKNQVSMKFNGFKNNKSNYKCKECKKRWLKAINGLIKKFSNIHQFCNRDINKFALLLKEGVQRYEYENSWEKCDETSLLDKKACYTELYLEHITDEDYRHAQKVFEEFNLKKPYGLS